MNRGLALQVDPAPRLQVTVPWLPICYWRGFLRPRSSAYLSSNFNLFVFPMLIFLAFFH